MTFSDVFAACVGSRRPVVRIAELCVIGVVYYGLAKGGLALASLHPSATPIWPPTGFALAVVLICGYRVWPAIFLGAMVANVTTAGSLATSLAIGAGNTLEGLLGGYLVNRFSGGRDTYATPSGVAAVSLLSSIPTALSATIGVASLAAAGFADWRNAGPVWFTWWLGDLAGALLIAPVIVLWAAAAPRRELAESAAVVAGACVVGLVAFSPLIEQTAWTAPLGFLAVIPLLWSALRLGQRDTATVALVLSCFAVWGALAGSGPFVRANLNDSFLLLLMFMIATAVPSLVLSADVAVRKRTDERLRAVQRELDERVDRRTAALSGAIAALQGEIENRWRIEAELGEQRVHLVEAQRLASLGSWIWHIDQDEMVWSDQLRDLYGLASEEFDGTFEGYLRHIHDDDRARVRAAITGALRGGHGFRLDERIVRPDGEVRHLSSRGEVMKDADGRVVRMLGVCQDVTERLQGEAALRESETRLAQAQKMEAIGQLTGGIAHDFNNILMIVSGHAEMLRRRVAEPKALSGLAAIERATRRGETLTRQLLTFARRQPLSPAVVDLKERVEVVRDMLGSSLRGNITLVVNIPVGLWPVQIDVAEFELALLNLAVNARDAMPQGGSVTLAARNIDGVPGRTDGPLAGDCVELTIADTGAGIPADVMPKIFDPFFTTKAVGKGTGLGLSQVYGFAVQSNGAVTAKSDVGRGTTITIWLPRSRAAKSPGLETREAVSTAHAGGTILVVEDNPEVADVTATLLEQIGYQVLRAENAADALGTLQAGDAVDLVFSDIVMPGGMNGIHLAQEVNQLFPRIGVLLTTGYSDMVAAAETRYPILRKPFEVSALERAVCDALAGPRGRGGRRAAR